MSRALLVKFTPPAAYRGGELAPTQQFWAQSMRLVWSWGTEPAAAEIVYVGLVAVASGDWLEIRFGPFIFYGYATTNLQAVTTSGTTSRIRFVDNRDYLDWDMVYCAFNLRDETIIGGTKVRRYKHMLPADFNAGRWTYTTTPYTAAQILDYIFDAPTVEDPWTRSYHADQVNFPVYDLDWSSSGVKLRGAIEEVTTKQGLVLTLMGGRFNLVWMRKGEGSLAPIDFTTVGDRSEGVSITGHPTRIRVLGGRNVYQVHDIPMAKDWVTAWEQFYDMVLFEQEIFLRGRLQMAMAIGGNTYPAGTKYTEVSPEDDPEQQVTRQLAKARALEITLREFVDLVDLDDPGDGSQFADFRKFGGHSRMDIPASIYISSILFRAFKFQPGFSIKNADELEVPIESLMLSNRMLAKVTHDPISGAMQWDVEENPDGVGYAVVQGYQVGHDLFATIRPERFRFSEWNNLQQVWQKVPIAVDDSGEPDSRFILFQDPVIRSSDLVQIVNGYGVFKANPTFTTPAVRVALCFEAERFSYVKGNGTRDDCESVSELYYQGIAHHGDIPAEIPFSGGITANQKADEIATAILHNQFASAKGQFENFLLRTEEGWTGYGYQLNGRIDRVELDVSPGGIKEIVHLTTEAPRSTYVPERELDRQQRYRQLVPGQAELRTQANQFRLVAAALREDPRARKTLSQAFKGTFGPGRSQLQPILLENGAGLLPVGTPLWKKPGVTLTDGSKSNTRAVMPAAVTDTHSEFVGATTRDGENAAYELWVAREGDILVRVMGPCASGDPVGRVSGQGYLSAQSDRGIVGTALESISGANLKVIKVRNLATQPNSLAPVWL